MSSILQVDIFTLFPAMFEGPFSESILKRAQSSGAVEIAVHDIRTWTSDRHRTADDTPYGGGAGMVMKVEPIVTGVEAVLGDDAQRATILLMAASGARYTQPLAHELSMSGRLVIICGHYEGIDERVIEILGAQPVSIGDFVLTGGELPAMVIVDSVVRLIPGVIDARSIADESHGIDGEGHVEYPHYTRPVSFRGHDVPSVLLSGHHAEIERWRRDQARVRTTRWRPDLLKPDPN